MELARDPRAENEQTSILFIASSQECLKDGYSVRPIQYLYKPVDRAELAQALETNLCLHHRPDRVTLRLGHRCCRWIPCSMPKARATARWPPFPTASCGSTAVPPPLPRTAGKKKHS